MRTFDANKLAAVVPSGLYSAAATGAMFGRSGRAAREWCRAGKLDYSPDPIDPRKYVIRGESILRLAGELAQASAPAPSETDRQRADRGRAALADIQKLTRKAKG